MADDSMKTLIVLGVGAVAAWYLYEQGYLYSWTGIAALYPGTLPTTPTTTTTAPLTTTPVTTAPVTTTPAPAAPAALPAFSITSAVSPDINNSLQAMVSINGGTPISIAIIQSGSESGHAYNSAGQDITATLTGEGVSVPALLAAMQAASSAGVSGLGMFVGTRIPIYGAHGMGFPRVRRGALQ